MSLPFLYSHLYILFWHLGALTTVVTIATGAWLLASNVQPITFFLAQGDTFDRARNYQYPSGSKAREGYKVEGGRGVIRTTSLNYMENRIRNQWASHKYDSSLCKDSRYYSDAV